MNYIEEHTDGNYYDEHTTNSKDIKSGWIMILVVSIGLVILSL